MDELKIYKNAVKKMFGLTDAKLAELLYNTDEEIPVLKDDALDIILSKNADKIQSIKDENKDAITEANDKGYKRCQAELMPKLEKEFKEKTGLKLSDDLKGVDLFVAGVESVKQAIPTEPTLDQIKASSVFIEMERKLKEEKDTAVNEVKGEFEKFKSDIDRRQIFSTYKDRAWNQVLGKKPIIEEGKIGENRKNAFLSVIDNIDIKNEKGTEVLLNKDGSRIEDGQGNALTFEQYVENVSSDHFKFEVQNPKGGAGNSGEGGGSGAIIITSDEDFRKKVANATTQEQKNALLEAYRAYAAK